MIVSSFLHKFLGKVQESLSQITHAFGNEPPAMNMPQPPANNTEYGMVYGQQEQINPPNQHMYDPYQREIS